MVVEVAGTGAGAGGDTVTIVGGEGVVEAVMMAKGFAGKGEESSPSELSSMGRALEEIVADRSLSTAAMGADVNDEAARDGASGRCSVGAESMMRALLAIAGRSSASAGTCCHAVVAATSISSSARSSVSSETNPSLRSGYMDDRESRN